MSEVIITVRGEHAVSVTAERGVATVSVRLDGPARADVVARAAAAAATITEDLRAFTASGAVTTFSSDRVAIWSDRPWNNEGVQLPLVYHATLTTRATFVDIASLSEWITDLADREGITVDDVAWLLSPETTTRIEGEVSQAAVGVAVSRARAYAAALGLSDVTAESLADVGLLDTPSPERRMFAAAASADGASFTLEPRELRISRAVEARFSAR